jgi:hypothetical protein
MITIPADEIQAGDTIAYYGAIHVITCVERRAGWAWPVAADGTGWALALGRHLVDVLREAA